MEAAVAETVEAFGGLDVCVNNASAISLTGTLETPMKRYDLMHDINARGTFMVSQKCIPHLEKSDHAHILNLSPPLDMRPRWFRNHVAYTMAKYGMSLCVLGMAEELRGKGIAVNALWPLTAIDTAAVRNVLGDDRMAKMSRLPEIVADAAHAILARDPASCTGQFLIDEEVLREVGVEDFSALPARGRDGADGRLLRPRRGVRPLADEDRARDGGRLTRAGVAREASAPVLFDEDRHPVRHSSTACRSAGLCPYARFSRNRSTVSSVPTFSATAAAMNWFRETPSARASLSAADFTECGNLRR